MTTQTVPIQFTCPEWCDRPAGEHARSLWDYDGNCIHYSADRVITDPVGYQEALSEPRFNPPVR